MSKQITLDTFMAGERPQVVDLAAQLGTDRDAAPYQAVPYGRNVEILSRLNLDQALITEIEQTMADVGMPGTATLDDALGKSFIIGAELRVLPNGGVING